MEAIVMNKIKSFLHFSVTSCPEVYSQSTNAQSTSQVT